MKAGGKIGEKFLLAKISGCTVVHLDTFTELYDGQSTLNLGVLCTLSTFLLTSTLVGSN